MKINFQKYLTHQSNIVNWAVIHMMAKRENRIGLPEWKMKHAGGPMDTANLDIKLLIEGVEVGFIECIEEINRQHNQMVREDAKALVNEQFSDLHDKFNELTVFMDGQIEKKKKELGWIE